MAPSLHNRLGIAMARQAYRRHAEQLRSDRWQALQAAGARPQRLLWASTGTKDPAAADTLYVEALAAPDTINTLPEKTLLAFADHGRVGPALAADGGGDDGVLEELRRAGIDAATLAARLQNEGVQAFADSWHALMTCLRDKQAALAPAGAR
jgi:transaldolase